MIFSRQTHGLRQYSPRFENGIFSNLCLFSVFFVFFSYEYESRTKTKLSRKFNKPNYATSYIVMKIIKIQTCSVPFAKYHATPRHREILQSQIFCAKQILDSLYLVYNALTWIYPKKVHLENLVFTPLGFQSCLCWPPSKKKIDYTSFGSPNICRVLHVILHIFLMAIRVF